MGFERGGKPHNKSDLVGQEFGRLTVIEDSGERYPGKGRTGAILWACECECGAVVAVATHNLRSGNTRSCGCLHVDVSAARRDKGARASRPLLRCLRIDAVELKRRREEAIITQAELAELAAKPGGGGGAISQYETGASKHAHPAVVRRLADALGCATEDLISTAVTPGRSRPEPNGQPS